MSRQPSTAASGWDAQVSLTLLVESMPIAVVIVDSNGKIVYVNARLEAMFDYARDELLGEQVEILIPERFHRNHIGLRQGYMHQQKIRGMGSGVDLAGRRQDGTEFPIEAGLSPLKFDEETYVVATITDISKRKQVEEMLARQVEERTREVEHRQQVLAGLRSILSTLISNRPLPEVLDFIADKAATLLQADACIIYSRDERFGRLQSQATSGVMPSDWEQLLDDALTQQAPLYNEPMVLAHGMLPVQAFSLNLPTTLASPIDHGQSAYLSIPIRDTQQIYGLILLYYEQLQESASQDIELALRVADQTVLAIANAHLRGQIEHSAVTAERNRIARDLHDAVTQTLFSASIIAGVLPTIWQRDEKEGRRRLEELSELTRGALAEMRTLLLELRPAKLVEVDMADLLRQLAEAISGRARVPVTVEVEGDAEVSADVKVALYRVAQESLNNIAKHAQARNAWIKLYRSEDHVKLSVTDDGSGFTFDRFAPQHLGLNIMRERADGIGATLSVDTKPGGGTTVEVCWDSDNPITNSSFPNQ